jgi:hypothetical protein
MTAKLQSQIVPDKHSSAGSIGFHVTRTRPMRHCVTAFAREFHVDLRNLPFFVENVNVLTIMPFMQKSSILSSAILLGLCGSVSAAITLDGANIPSEGLDLLATQDSATRFGNAIGGGQDSAGGSELNQIYANIVGTTLELGITGNLEGNFNKMWIFFDGVAGGQNVLADDNADGGFGEINNLAGLTFDGGFTADRGIRIEIGSGYWGVNGFDLVSKTATSIANGGGPGDLALVGVAGAYGVSFGWDNSNVLGVDGSSSAAAATATTGWEFSIDMATFFGESPSSVGISTFVSNGDGGFLSNQVLPGTGGTDNLGSPSGSTVGFVTAVPEPSSCLLLSLGGLLMIRRKRP